MKLCNKCGRIMPDNAHYCGYCGNNLKKIWGKIFKFLILLLIGFGIYLLLKINYNYQNIVKNVSVISFALYDLDCDGDLELLTMREESDSPRVKLYVYDKVGGNVREVLSDYWINQVGVIPNAPYMAGYGTDFCDRYYVFGTENYKPIVIAEHIPTEEPLNNFGNINVFIDIVRHCSVIKFVDSSDENINRYINNGLISTGFVEGYENGAVADSWLKNIPSQYNIQIN